MFTIKVKYRSEDGKSDHWRFISTNSFDLDVSDPKVVKLTYADVSVVTSLPGMLDLSMEEIEKLLTLVTTVTEEFTGNFSIYVENSYRHTTHKVDRFG